MHTADEQKSITKYKKSITKRDVTKFCPRVDTAPSSYTRGPGYKSRPGDWLEWLTPFVVSPRLYTERSQIVQDSFLFTYCPTTRQYMKSSIQSIAKPSANDKQNL